MSDEHGHMVPRAVERTRRVWIDSEGRADFEVYYEYVYEWVPPGMLTPADETYVRQAAERPHPAKGDAKIFDYPVSEPLDTQREPEHLTGLGDFDAGDDT